MSNHGRADFDIEKKLTVHGNATDDILTQMLLETS